MDCLDRTNVVQGVFSRQIAHIQLAKMGLAAEPRGLPFETFTFKTLEQAFRNAWTDNADVLSLLYTGTPALKTDFTRTGKRSTGGAINDGKHSMIRYYINNFTDGYNNDCLDLSQGYITPQQKLNSRSFISPMKLALVTLIGTIFLSKFLLQEVFPYPDISMADISQSDYESASFKAWILHSLIYTGIFLVGLLGIQSKYRLYSSNPSFLH